MKELKIIPIRDIGTAPITLHCRMTREESIALFMREAGRIFMLESVSENADGSVDCRFVPETGNVHVVVDSDVVREDVSNPPPPN